MEEKNWWQRTWPGLLGGFVATLLLVGILLGLGPRLLARGQNQFAEDQIERLARRPAAQEALVDGMRQVFARDASFRKKVLEQRLQEQEALVRHPDLSEEAMKNNLDLLEKTAGSDVQGDRLQAVVLDVFRRIADNPELRPQLISLMLGLMQDPRARAALREMVSQAQAPPPPAPPPPAPSPPARQQAAPEAAPEETPQGRAGPTQTGR